MRINPKLFNYIVLQYSDCDIDPKDLVMVGKQGVADAWKRYQEEGRHTNFDLYAVHYVSRNIVARILGTDRKTLNSLLKLPVVGGSETLEKAKALIARIDPVAITKL